MPFFYRKAFFLSALAGLFSALGASAQKTTLYKPVHNAAFYDSTVVFNWKAVPGGAPYELQMSTDSTFATGTVSYGGIAGTGIKITGLAYGTRYWWRVNTASGTNSAGHRFEVINRPAMVRPGIWFRADSSVATSAGLVTTWTDLGDSARTATQPSPGLQPQLVQNGVSTKPYIHFGKQGTAGQATYLAHNSVRFAGPNFTVVSTHRLSSTAVILGYMLGGFQTGLFAGGTYQGGWNTGVFDGVNGRRIAGVPFTQWSTLSYTSAQIWRNAVSQTMTGANASQLKFALIGSTTDLPGTLFFHGDLAEVMIFPTVLADTVRQKFERYQMNKYGAVAQLPYDTNVCAPSLPLSLAGGTDEFSNILWSTGAVTPNITVTTDGTYWVRGTSRIGNYVTTDTIRVRGVFPLPQITPSTHQYFCFGQDSVTFHKVTNAPGVIYTWYNGSLADSIRVGSGNKVYITAFDPPSGCAVTSDTTLITHKTRADFANPAACPDVQAHFPSLSMDLTTDTVNTWLWNFGDPTTTADVSTDTNGVWTYAQSGTYTVTLKVTSSDGCADSISKNVTVKPSATPNFSWQGLCYGKPTQFFDQSTPENGTQVTGYQWTFGPGITSSFVNPAVTFDTAGSYPVTLKIFTASGCNETVTLPVPVNKGADAAFSVADSLCAKQNINILDQSQGVNDNITGWVWRFGSNTPVMGQAPAFAFQSTGNRVVRLTVTTAAGCVDSTQKTVYVRPTPTAAFSFVVNGGTPPFVPVVQNQSTDADHVAWNFGSGFNNTDYEPTLPAFADTGVYTVTLAVKNNEGCTDTTAKNFVVFTGDRTLQLLNATCTLDGGYVKYTARVLNKGALTVDDITFGAGLNYNSAIQEKWTGGLNPGQVLQYTFNASAKYFTSADFCCVRIERFNDTLHVQAPDDKICLPLGEGVWFSTAYPTPTDGMITIDRTLPFADKLSAELCSVDGKVMRKFFTNQAVNAGYGTYTADISDLRAGMYVVRFYYREKYYSVKVVKR